MNVQKLNPGFINYFNIGYLDVDQKLITGN